MARTKAKAEAVAVVETPEVLPPVKDNAVAVVVDEYATRVGYLHHAAQQHANASVLCAAIAGAVMHAKKMVCKHGEFTTWLETVAEANGITARTCRNYMAVADEMTTRLKALPKRKRVSFLGDGSDSPDSKRPLLQLLADMNPANLDELRAAAVAEAVREVTNDQTLRQLYFDWGIMKDRSNVRSGGDVEVQAWLREFHPKLVGTKLADLPEMVREAFIAYRDGRKPSDEEVIAAKREEARRFWERQRVCLTEMGGDNDPTWRALADQDLLQTMVTLENVAKAMKRVLNERGAR